MTVQEMIDVGLKNASARETKIAAYWLKRARIAAKKKGDTFLADFCTRQLKTL